MLEIFTLAKQGLDMIAAYTSSALIGVGVYFFLRKKRPKPRIMTSLGVFLALSALLTIWFIQTGGNYGIIGTNGITPDWAR